MKPTIGEKIALLRKAKNISQTELAEYLFLTPQTISRWEVGNGTPEITLLPKIAAFFSVSIDELFGITSIERAEDLVCKYSVLRDDRSFQEAMECVNSQLQSIDASCEYDAENGTELAEERDRLEAEKLHLWIQQGRESFKRAYAIADSFVKKTEGDPEHPCYLRMRLQRNQLLISMERGREALTACKKDFEENPGAVTLHLYLSLLNDLCRYEDILSILEAEQRVRDIILPPTKENLDIWWQLIHAAAETGEADFVARYIPPVLEACDEKDEYEFLLCLMSLYQKKNQQDKIIPLQNRLLDLLPRMSYNKYFEEAARKKIEQACDFVNIS